MKVRVGTSGYAYREWKGSFYPKTRSPRKMRITAELVQRAAAFLLRPRRRSPGATIYARGRAP